MLGDLFNRNDYRFPGPDPIMHYQDMHEIIRIEEKMRLIPQSSLTLNEAHRLLYYVASETRIFMMDQLKKQKSQRFIKFQQNIPDYNMNNFGFACIEATMFSYLLLKKMGVQDLYRGHSAHNMNAEHQHGFLIVKLPVSHQKKKKTMEFLVDTTYRQFFSKLVSDKNTLNFNDAAQETSENQWRGRPDKHMPGYKITKTSAGRIASDHLLKFGFVYFGLAMRDAYLSSFIPDHRLKAADRYLKNGKRHFPYFEENARYLPCSNSNAQNIEDTITQTPLERKYATRRTPRAGYLFQ